MRRMKIVLALFVAFLTGSSSVSAAVCDLSCSLQQTSPDCHGVGSAANGTNSAAAMPSMPGMDSDSSASIMPRMNMNSDASGTSGAVSNTSSGHNYPGRQSAPKCPHKTCSLTSTASSSQGTNHFQFSLFSTTLPFEISDLLTPDIALHETAPWTPPKSPAVTCLALALRI